jgi:ribosomal protein S18 acetylase RimI-like enzyme
MNIVKLSELGEVELQERIEEVKSIFFLCTSVKTFRDQEHKNNFFNKWCGGYIDKYPSEFNLAISDNKVLGYLSGCLNSKKNLTELSIPGAPVFEDLYDSYPAHLHINCHPISQGKGVGRFLIESFCESITEKKLSGIHLITSTDADNLGFYRKLKFTEEYTREFKGMDLHLMGRKIFPK